MHELAIAQDIVRQVKEEASRLGTGKIKVLHIKLGPRAFATKESLAFCLQASSEGTVVEDAQVQITEVNQGGVVLDSIDVEE